LENREAGHGYHAPKSYRGKIELMGLAQLVVRAAAMLGMHVSRLSKQPFTTVMGRIYRPIDLILDIGANEGQFAREMRAKFPHAHIISVEPLPGPFATLASWAKADGNATALNLALGEAEAVLQINVHLDHSTSSSLLATHAEGLDTFPEMTRQHSAETPVRRLDDVLAEINRAVGENTLLKLDVQGFEEMVLRGAPKTLERVGALLTEVCIDPLYEGQAEFFALCRIAREAGLRYAGNYSQYCAKDGHVIFLDAFFAR
jgi:FkbM family methyltransferase